MLRTPAFASKLVFGGKRVVQLVAVGVGDDAVDFDGAVVGVGGAGDVEDGCVDWQGELGCFVLGGAADADGFVEVCEVVSGFFEAGVDAAGAGVFVFDGGAGGEVGGDVGDGELDRFVVGVHESVADEDGCAGFEFERGGYLVVGGFGADFDVGVGCPSADRGVRREGALSGLSFGSGESVVGSVDGGFVHGGFLSGCC